MIFLCGCWVQSETHDVKHKYGIEKASLPQNPCRIVEYYNAFLLTAEYNLVKRSSKRKLRFTHVSIEQWKTLIRFVEQQKLSNPEKNDCNVEEEDLETKELSIHVPVIRNRSIYSTFYNACILEFRDTRDPLLCRKHQH